MTILLFAYIVLTITSVSNASNDEQQQALNTTSQVAGPAQDTQTYPANVSSSNAFDVQGLALPGVPRPVPYAVSMPGRILVPYSYLPPVQAGAVPLSTPEPIQLPIAQPSILHYANPIHFYFNVPQIPALQTPPTLNVPSSTPSPNVVPSVSQLNVAPLTLRVNSAPSTPQLNVLPNSQINAAPTSPQLNVAPTTSRTQQAFTPTARPATESHLTEVPPSPQPNSIPAANITLDSAQHQLKVAPLPESNSASPTNIAHDSSPTLQQVTLQAPGIVSSNTPFFSPNAAQTLQSSTSAAPKLYLYLSPYSNRLDTTPAPNISFDADDKTVAKTFQDPKAHSSEVSDEALQPNTASAPNSNDTLASQSRPQAPELRLNVAVDSAPETISPPALSPSLPPLSNPAPNIILDGSQRNPPNTSSGSGARSSAYKSVQQSQAFSLHLPLNAPSVPEAHFNLYSFQHINSASLQNNETSQPLDKLQSLQLTVNSTAAPNILSEAAIKSPQENTDVKSQLSFTAAPEVPEAHYFNLADAPNIPLNVDQPLNLQVSPASERLSVASAIQSNSSPLTPATQLKSAPISHASFSSAENVKISTLPVSEPRFIPTPSLPQFIASVATLNLSLNASPPIQPTAQREQELSHSNVAPPSLHFRVVPIHRINGPLSAQTPPESELRSNFALFPNLAPNIQQYAQIAHQLRSSFVGPSQIIVVSVPNPDNIRQSPEHQLNVASTSQLTGDPAFNIQQNDQIGVVPSPQIIAIPVPNADGFQPVPEHKTEVTTPLELNKGHVANNQQGSRIAPLSSTNPAPIPIEPNSLTQTVPERDLNAAKQPTSLPTESSSPKVQQSATTEPELPSSIIPSREAIILPQFQSNTQIVPERLLNDDPTPKEVSVSDPIILLNTQTTTDLNVNVDAYSFPKPSKVASQITQQTVHITPELHLNGTLSPQINEASTSNIPLNPQTNLEIHPNLTNSVPQLNEASPPSTPPEVTYTLAEVSTIQLQPDVISETGSQTNTRPPLQLVFQTFPYKSSPDDKPIPNQPKQSLAKSQSSEALLLDDPHSEVQNFGSDERPESS